MAWNTPVSFLSTNALTAAMLNGVGYDFRQWGGNVNGGGNILSNVVVVPLGVTANFSTTFSGVSSLTVLGTSHGLKLPNLAVMCLDNSSPRRVIQPASITIDDTTFDVTVNFASLQTGKIALLGPSNSVGPSYSQDISALSIVTITGATHALGTSLIFVSCVNNSSPRSLVQPASITIDDTTHDVVLVFASPFTGKVYFFSGASSTSGSAPIILGATITSQSDLIATATVKTNGTSHSAGTGSPNGSVTGSPGDTYVNKTGGAGTTLYVKESGVGTNTGWVGK